MAQKIPFSKFWLSGNEKQYLNEVLDSGWLTGDGPFTKKCHNWLERQAPGSKALLTHSGTAALEMAALLLDIRPGDEIIMPSFTFVSTANAFVLRGARPVFVDIELKTLNLDLDQVALALTPQTRAIVPINYAGIPAQLDRLAELCSAQKNLSLIEDNAHGILSRLHDKPLGTWGRLGALSFHGTKNLVGGECGALLINDSSLAHRAEVIREKGTNRAAFFRGEVDKYTWVETGSSFLPSELVAAVLWAQFEKAEEIQKRRLHIWNTYHRLFEDTEKQGRLRRPTLPLGAHHNGHIYYVLVRDLSTRTRILAHLKELGVQATFHYVPLHSSPQGQKVGRAFGPLEKTQQAADCLVRLPLYPEMTSDQAQQIGEHVIRGL